MKHREVLEKLIKELQVCKENSPCGVSTLEVKNGSPTTQLN